jgi:UDP-N-acetylglucosamine--N-acetylmuramyl-(pentapeptide) pyrophosphoryl-undecaprenol N-acetylglucosamine transferase
VILKRKEGKQLLPNSRIIISGGGTGGHIFPAIAIANALKVLEPAIEILFVGANGRMEMEKVPAAGYKIEGLNITGLQRSLKLSNLKFPFRLLSSLMKAGKIIDRFNPQVAVGVGGYASGPLLYMAGRKKIPCLIQEQNSYPGITNKLLATRVQKICVAYDKMDRFFPASKIILTGNPVREDMVIITGKKNDAAKFFDLDTEKPTLLVVGGSQGARSINRAVNNNLEQIHQSGVQLIWQCGKIYFPEAQAALARIGNPPGIRAYDFINRMDFAYAMADVIISRAGASTVSELCIIGKPAILVPLPTAAEDHQTHNCKALVEKNAAMLIKDEDATTSLVQTALQLISDENKRKELSRNISSMAIRNAAQTIAAEVIKLIKN